MTVAVVVFPGSNCEHDVVHALHRLEHLQRVVVTGDVEVHPVRHEQRLEIANQPIVVRPAAVRVQRMVPDRDLPGRGRRRKRAFEPRHLLRIAALEMHGIGVEHEQLDGRVAAVGTDGTNEIRLYHMGLSFKPHPQVVLKLDYRNFRPVKGGKSDDLHLGVGVAF